MKLWWFPRQVLFWGWELVQLSPTALLTLLFSSEWICNSKNYSQPQQNILRTLYAFWTQERYLNSLLFPLCLEGGFFRRSLALLVFSLQVPAFAPRWWWFMYWSLTCRQRVITSLPTTAATDVSYLITELPTAIPLKHHSTTYSMQPSSPCPLSTHCLFVQPDVHRMPSPHLSNMRRV